MASAQPGGTSERMEQWRQRRERLLQMGGKPAIDERHAKGQLSARERLDVLFDAGSFVELGMWMKHRTTAFGMDKREVPAEGIITGFGTVNGRTIVAAAEALTGHAAGAVAFATEAPFLDRLGLETLILGPGDIAQAHQPDEYLEAGRIQPTIEILQGLIRRFCQTETSS